MSLPEYPEWNLPPPETGPFERNQSTRETDVRFGGTNYALVERAFRGTQEVTFLFSAEQAAFFRTFWLDTLSRGGRWFTTRWPLPSGWFNPLGVRKFLAPPVWRHIGNGAWRVSAITELVASRNPPSVRFSSLTYPITMLDEIIASMGSANADRVGYVEAMTSNFESTGGTIAVKRHSYSYEEYIVPSLTSTGGTIRTVLKQYAMDPETIGSSMRARNGTIRLARIAYDIDPEFIGSEFNCLGGTLT